MPEKHSSRWVSLPLKRCHLLGSGDQAQNCLGEAHGATENNPGLAVSSKKKKKKNHFLIFVKISSSLTRNFKNLQKNTHITFTQIRQFVYYLATFMHTLQ